MKIEKTLTIKTDRENIFADCKKFSELVDVSWYGARDGQNNESKKREQQLCGKISEFLVWNYLNHIGITCSKPDLSVYGTSRKSWGADLICGDELFEVKSISEGKDSWIIQTKSKYDSCLNIALVEVCKPFEKLEGKLFGIYKWSDLSLILKPSRLYPKTKSAVYKEDLYLI